MKAPFLAVSAGLALPFGFTAATAQPTPAPAVETADEDASERRICRRSAAPTGSRIGSRRICKTQAEWNALQRQNRDAIERAQGAGTFGNSGRSTSTYGPGG